MEQEGLKQYLKTVSDLEAARYGNQQMQHAIKQKQQEIQKSLADHEPKPDQFINKPESYRNFGYQVFQAFWVSIAFRVIAFTPIGMFLGENIAEHDEASALTSKLSIVLFLVMLAVAFYRNRFIFSHNADLDRHNAEAPKKFEDAMARFRQSDFFAQQQTALLHLGQELATVSGYLERSESSLAEVYRKDIIFEKYRVFPCTTQMYEYMASGRCSQLEGPEGAYNLYESELRANVIIDKLETIVSQLGNIERNQYVIMHYLQDISASLSTIRSQLSSIELSASAAAVNASIVAYNTNLLRYSY